MSSGEGRWSRRDLLVAGGVAAAGAATGAGVQAALSGAEVPASARFDGPHEQPGIVGEQRRHLALATFALGPDVQPTELVALLRDWSGFGRAFMAGDPAPRSRTMVDRIGGPADTGEAAGLSPAGATVTLGFGPEVFLPERGLVKHPGRQRELAIPPFQADALRDHWTGGDVALVVTSDDPQVAVHGVRQMALMAQGPLTLRSVQRGFLPSTPDGQTPRNLMGFKDGTANLDTSDASQRRRLLWAGAEAPEWLRGGGTYLVVRRIRMRLSEWDRSPLVDQEATFGRTKDSGAPLGSREEHDTVDLRARGADGTPRVPPSSHVAVARTAVNAGHQVLRRPWSFADDVDPVTGQLDAGLLLLTYQRSIQGQFVPLQRALDTADALRDYTDPIGSAAYVVPPAARGHSDFPGSGFLSGS